MNTELIHVIRCADPKESGGAIAEIETCDFFGIPCVKGKLLQLSPKHWAAGTTVYFPIAKIAGITVFDNKEAWIAGMSRHKSKAHQNVRARIGRATAWILFFVAALLLGRFSSR